MKNIFTCDFTLVSKETANDKLLGKDSLHEAAELPQDLTNR